jgi:hypothetical protein
MDDLARLVWTHPDGIAFDDVRMRPAAAGVVLLPGLARFMRVLAATIAAAGLLATKATSPAGWTTRSTTTHAVCMPPPARWTRPSRSSTAASTV